MKTEKKDMSQENSLCALPERIDLGRLAEQDAVYETKLNHEIMTRLADACEEIEEPALVKLHFYKDLQGLSTLEGEISCKLKLICERCGKPFSTVINAPFCVTCDKEKAFRRMCRWASAICFGCCKASAPLFRRSTCGLQGHERERRRAIASLRRATMCRFRQNF